MKKDFKFKKKYNIDDLISIIHLLRQPDGCPWDRVQTHESIKKKFIEETYEVIEAINKSSSDMLREELGDVLLQIMLHCEMENEKNTFSFSDIVDELCRKLIIRHPHVFSDVKCTDSNDVLEVWNEVKMKTKSQETYHQAMLSVPLELPALMRAQKVQQKAAEAGFDWEDINGAFESVESELNELKQTVDNNDRDNMEEELGDLLFSCVNVSRFIKFDSEETLTNATNKFTARFGKAEQLAKKRGINMKTASLDELNSLWDEAKKCPNTGSLPLENIKIGG